MFLRGKYFIFSFSSFEDGRKQLLITWFLVRSFVNIEYGGKIQNNNLKSVLFYAKVKNELLD